MVMSQPLVLLVVLSLFLHNVGRCSSSSSNCNRTVSPICIAAGRPEGTYFVLDCSSSIPVLRYQVPEYLDELSWLFVECTASGVTTCQDISDDFSYERNIETALPIPNVTLTEAGATCTATMCFDQLYSIVASVNSSCTFLGLFTTEVPMVSSTAVTSTAVMAASAIYSPPSASPLVLPMETPISPPKAATTPPSNVSQRSLMVALLLTLAVALLSVAALVAILYNRNLRRRRKAVEYRLTFPYLDRAGSEELPDGDAFSVSSFFSKLQISQSLYSVFDRLENKVTVVSDSSQRSSHCDLDSKGVAESAALKSSRDGDEDSTIVLPDTHSGGSSGEHTHRPLSVVNESRPETPYVKAEDVTGPTIVATTTSSTPESLVPSEELLVEDSDLTLEESMSEQRNSIRAINQHPSVMAYTLGESDSGYIILSSHTPSVGVDNKLDFNSGIISVSDSESIDNSLSGTLIIEQERVASECDTTVESRRNKLHSQSSSVSFMLTDVVESFGNDNHSLLTKPSPPNLELFTSCVTDTSEKCRGDESVTGSCNDITQLQQSTAKRLTEIRQSSEVRPAVTSPVSSLDSDRDEDAAYLPSDISTASKLDGYIASNSSGYGTDDLPYLPSDFSTTSNACGYLPSNSSGYATDELPYLPSDVSCITTSSSEYFPSRLEYSTDDPSHYIIPSGLSTGNSYNNNTNHCIGHTGDMKLSNVLPVSSTNSSTPANSSSRMGQLANKHSGDHLCNSESTTDACTARSKYAPFPDGYVTASDAIPSGPSSCAQSSALLQQHSSQQQNHLM